jgi:hypothetical protein
MIEFELKIHHWVYSKSIKLRLNVKKITDLYINYIRQVGFLIEESFALYHGRHNKLFSLHFV